MDEASNGGGPSEADEHTLAVSKVHLRGLDTFKPDDIKAYVKQHFGAGDFSRIEWIDDTSANLVFASESTAAEALVALCAVEIADATQLQPLELLPAKPYSPKPDATIQLRFAVVADRKQVGAAARSRFYLLHPEYDPEERRRRGDFDRGRYRDRDGDQHRRSGGAGRRRDDRRDEEPTDSFDVSLYDDDEATLARRAGPQAHRRSRSHSRSSGSDVDRYARRNKDKELFPDRARRERNGQSSLRDRSASPPRTPDWDISADGPLDREGAASRNRDKARSIKDRLFRGNSAKELFPTKVSAREGKAQMDQLDPAVKVTKQLSGMSVSYICDEGSNHCARGSGGCQHWRQTLGAGDSSPTKLSPASLTDQITRPSDVGINIRGIANQRGANQGIAIKGAATSARELFPNKLDSSNAGKELFSNKLDGARRPRQRAEDLFH